MLVSNALTIGITVVNFVIRGINIWLVGLIRLHTISSQLLVISMSIFIATFLNTGMVLLLGQANLDQTALGFIPFNGAYKDLTESWYINIGPALVSAMLLNSIYIYLDFGIAYGTKFFFRSLD